MHTQISGVQGMGGAIYGSMGAEISVASSVFKQVSSQVPCMMRRTDSDGTHCLKDAFCSEICTLYGLILVVLCCCCCCCCVVAA